MKIYEKGEMFVDHSLEKIDSGCSYNDKCNIGIFRIYFWTSFRPGKQAKRTSSQGPDSSKYTEYYLQGAHGVLWVWDPEREVLWALGDLYLVSLIILINKIKRTMININNLRI
jgi:hypothetical protein